MTVCGTVVKIMLASCTIISRIFGSRTPENPKLNTNNQNEKIQINTNFDKNYTHEKRFCQNFGKTGFGFRGKYDIVV